jgi:hypothetical protein
MKQIHSTSHPGTLLQRICHDMTLSKRGPFTFRHDPSLILTSSLTPVIQRLLPLQLGTQNADDNDAFWSYEHQVIPRFTTR